MTASDAALLESVVFLDHFADFADPRQLSKVIYPLDEILLLGLLAVVAGADLHCDRAVREKRSSVYCGVFAPFANGTPDHDRLGEVFAALDAEQFQRCFVAWVATLTGAPAEVIAIDGKTSRRSYQKKGGLNPIHMVSAFAARQRCGGIRHFRHAPSTPGLRGIAAKVRRDCTTARRGRIRTAVADRAER